MLDNMYKYAVGSSPTFQEAVTYSKQVKERFPDAFIIAVKDNKIIPLDQALKESAANQTQKTENMKLTREFKIGFVALLAVALAIWGINYLKGINIFKSTDNYYAVYSNVKGLG